MTQRKYMDSIQLRGAIYGGIDAIGLGLSIIGDPDDFDLYSTRDRQRLAAKMTKAIEGIERALGRLERARDELEDPDWEDE